MFYETLNQTVEDLNSSIPALIKEKLKLKAELKTEKEQVTFMRHEMTSLKQQQLAQLAEEAKNF